MMSYTLTEAHFDPANSNEHFLIFLEAEGHKAGDELESHDYTLWVSEQVATLKKEYGLEPYDSLGGVPDWRNTLTRYLRSLIDKREQEVESERKE